VFVVMDLAYGSPSPLIRPFLGPVG
jgi:hypothetical protein